MTRRLKIFWLALLLAPPALPAEPPATAPLWLRIRFEGVSPRGRGFSETFVYRDGLVTERDVSNDLPGFSVRGFATAAEMATLRRALTRFRIEGLEGGCKCNCAAGAQDALIQITIDWFPIRTAAHRLVVGNGLVFSEPCSLALERLTLALDHYVGVALDSKRRSEVRVEVDEPFP